MPQLTSLSVPPGYRQLICPVWTFPIFATLRLFLFLFHAVGVDSGLKLDADHVTGLQTPVSWAVIGVIRTMREIAKERRAGDRDFMIDD